MRYMNKTVIITGGGGGIGRGMALGFAAEGARVGVCDIEASAAKAAADEIIASGRTAQGYELDICEEAMIEAKLDRISEDLGVPDVLIHCAAVNRLMPVMETPVSEWRRILDVNLTGAFLMARATARLMIPKSLGRIVLISSNTGFRGAAHRAAYAASKAAVINLAQTMAIELAHTGITVNCIAPGPTDTPMTAWQPPEIRRALISDVPLGRYGRIEEIVAGALFLASDPASYVTGHTLAIDGGFVGAGIIHPSIGAEALP